MSEKSNNETEQDLAEVILDDINKFEYFSLTYWKHIVAVGVGIVIVVAVVATVSYMQKSKNEAIITEVNSAKTVAELENVIKKYPTHKSILGAELKLVKLALDKKDYPTAIKYYQALSVSTLAPFELRSRAMLNIGYLLEKENKLKEAIEQYKKVGATPTASEYVQAEALYSAARLCKATKAEKEAATLLKRVEGLNASYWNRQAIALLNQLAVK